MADAHGGGGGDSPIKFAFIFFGIIAAIWYFGGQGTGGGIFGNASSSVIRLDRFSSSSTTAEGGTSTRTSYWSTKHGREETISAPSPREIERSVYDSSRALSRLRDDVEVAKQWGVLSPYKGMIRLRGGSASQSDPDREYLSLSYVETQGEPITLTGWTLESTVTATRVTIPPAVRLPRYGAQGPAPLALEPRETVVVVTGESPIGASFHENLCTGYLTEHQTFVPALSRSCPRPRDEMERARIAQTDDSCYDVIGRVPACSTVSRDILREHLSSACESFLKNDLTYAGCVRNHQYEPYFYKGSWRVYLEQHKDLWREDREVIRLLDAEGKTVDILTY